MTPIQEACYFNQALFELYPQVKSVAGDIAYDADGNVVDYDSAAVTEQAGKNACKQKASELLYLTDWTTIPDVASPTNNPYLTNQTEFITYRNILRGYAVNPVVDPVWPVEPTPVWQ
jgi:hypothetical protein